MIFYWLTPFSDSFVVCDWFELVIYFHTNERDDKQNVFTVNFQTTAIYDKVLGQIYANFWERDISRRTAESNRYVFQRKRCLRFVTNWLWKIFTISSSASDRSPLLSRRKWSLHFLCHPLKLSQETTCTIS